MLLGTSHARPRPSSRLPPPFNDKYWSKLLVKSPGQIFFPMIHPMPLIGRSSMWGLSDFSYTAACETFPVSLVFWGLCCQCLFLLCWFILLVRRQTNDTEAPRVYFHQSWPGKSTETGPESGPLRGPSFTLPALRGWRNKLCSKWWLRQLSSYWEKRKCSLLR